MFAANFYVCARIFKISIFGGLYSIEGVHIALAKAIESGTGDFFRHWYTGIPYPNTYPPLMPSIVGTLSRWLVHDTGLAYHIVCGIFYCLGPVALFLLLHELSRKISTSFLAALAVSAISPSIWFVPGILDELHSNLFWIEGGELAYPVEEITIAGNLKEMFAGIEMVGNDLVFRGRIASPTIKIGEMTIAGS